MATLGQVLASLFRPATRPVPRPVVTRPPGWRPVRTPGPPRHVDRPMRVRPEANRPARDDRPFRGGLFQRRREG